MTICKEKPDLNSGSPTSLNDLPNSLLEEILYRSLVKEIFYPLRLFAANRFRLVCKRWHSLISEPYFRDKFFPYKNRYALLSLDDAVPPPKIFFYPSFEPEGLPLSLDSTPLKAPLMDIVACSKDLVLFWNDDDEYVVCNLVTKEWVSIPRLVSVFEDQTGHCIAFTTKSNGEFVIFNTRPSEDKSYLDVKIFYSSKLVWVETVLACPRRLDDILLRMGMPCEEQAFWLDGATGTMVGIDPFDMIDQQPSSCFYIDPPKEFVSNNGDYDDTSRLSNLGVCQGSLRQCQVSKADFILRVWDLKDNEWKFYIQISLRNIVKELPVVKGCDPNDPTLIYIYERSQPRSSIDLCSGEINVVRPCPAKAFTHYFHPYEFQGQPTRLSVSNDRI